MQNPNNLENRTLLFSQQLLSFARTLKLDRFSTPILDQLLRSGTSIGANYCEANESESKRDFLNKIKIARAEAKETLYWLRLINPTEAQADQLDILRQECYELLLILSSIYTKSRN